MSETNTIEAPVEPGININDLPSELSPNAVRDVPPNLRDRLLFNEQADQELPTEPEQETQPTQEFVPEPQADVADDESLPKNFRIHTEDPKLSSFFKTFKAVQQVNPNVNPLDVAKIVGYDYENAPTSEIPGLENPEPQELSDLDIARGELETIEERLDSVASNEDLFNADVAALIKQHGKISSKITKLEIRSDFSNEVQQGQKISARNQSKNDVLQEYPSANSDDTLLGAEIARTFQQIQLDINHPGHAMLARNDGPRWITEQAAKTVITRLQKDLGMTEAQATAAIKNGAVNSEASRPENATSFANATQTRPVPRNVLVTAPGGRYAPEQPTITKAQALEMARNNPKARDAALGWGSNLIIR
jgi:hypothetical protein